MQILSKNILGNINKAGMLLLTVTKKGQPARDALFLAVCLRENADAFFYNIIYRTFI